MFEVERFVAECRAALAEPAAEVAVRDLVARATAAPSEMEAALGTPSRGDIVTLHRSDELTILNVVWAPGMAIYPHDHRMWAVIGLYGGREDNTFYRRAPEGLVVAGGKQLDTSDAVVLGRQVIHAVANPLRRFTGAIHVYGGDFFATPRSEWDPETRVERPFDVERARATFREANEQWARETARSG
jgi:predicted metal-dependent enzyme (double-stranded beta helix superfamily)